MSPLSLPVLGGAAVMSSPALYGAFVDGTTTMETALTRFLICALLCWIGFSVLESLVGPPPRAIHPDADGVAASGESSTDGELAA